MSSDPGDFSGRRPPRGAQGASRGGFRPDDADDVTGRGAPDDEGVSGRRGSQDPPFGGYPFGNDRSRGRSGGSGGKSATFLGLPVNLIYAIGAAIIGIVILGAVCGRPTATATGTVAGQVKALGADRAVSTLSGAQIVVRGAGQTYTATSTDAPANAEGEAAYNYRIENVPPGKYTMAVTPPAGSNLQPEQDISFEVESGQLFPQSVLLLADGIQKPRALAQNELRPGEAGGYINERGERVVYQQGSGFDASDALLLYLLWRNPGGWGYGYPPVIVNSPGGSSTSGYNYRVSDPPTQTRTGQTVTQQKPSTPGQGAVRPSSGSGATGSGPSYSSGPSSSGSSSGTSSGSGSSTSSSGSSTSTQTKPSTSSGSGSSVSAPNVPSQGASRPSSSSSSPSRSSAPSRSSGSSSGGRR